MSSLRGKVVVITGAASGIGFATAHLLAQHGALLSLADMNEKGLATAAEKLRKVYPPEIAQDAVITTLVNVTSPKECEDWIARTTTHFNQAIAGAANFAGVVGKSIAQEAGAVRNMSDAEFQFIMDINCRGTFNCIRAELPFMQNGDKGRNGGSIVNAASIAGISGVPNNGPYAASKHAVIGLTRTVAKEEGHRAIRVNAVAPGIIATPMMEQIVTSAGTERLFGDTDPGALARKAVS
ncbi:Levodione reductase [Lachnellula arida]|uniref:Levodione reductase n=1 Tax=Lachnellula arida TaxID=1316785 RepID=A0A8T9BIT4_9HELO|nr:Levodione reductase [Lachnellula arida]